MNHNLSVNKLEPVMLQNSSERNCMQEEIRLFPSNIPDFSKIPGLNKTQGQSSQLSYQENAADAADETEEDGRIQFLHHAESLLLPRFELNDMDHPAVKEIFRLAKLCLAERLAYNPKPNLQTIRRSNTKRHGEILFGKNRNCKQPAGRIELNLEELDHLSLPELVLEIQEAMLDPKYTAATMAGIMENYPGISRRLLKVVNSSFYNLPLKIEDVFQAATILGSKRISILVQGLTIRSVFREIAPSSMDINKFWNHSMACAIAARAMGAAKRGLNNERLFIAGLLHDAGRLILKEKFPEFMSLAENKAVYERKAKHLSEQEIIGMDHAEAGGLLVSKWKFSLILEQIISCHHEPALSVHPVETAIVHVADVLTNACTGNIECKENIPPLDPYAWEILKLDPAVFSPCLRRIERVLGQNCQNSK